MLEFAADKYLNISHQFGVLLAKTSPSSVSTNELDAVGFSNLLNCIVSDSKDLGLTVTAHHIGNMLLELVKSNPDKVAIDKNGMLHVRNGHLATPRLHHHVEAVYATLRAEIGSTTFYAIPKEKIAYCKNGWLADFKVFAKYPDSVAEFQKAGRCYAYGENTACVFHLMRVAEFYFRRVAISLDETFDPDTWKQIGDLISKNMAKQYRDKDDEWRRYEAFYATILGDIQALAKVHRNPALHDLEKNYDEREAKRMLDVIEALAEHVVEHEESGK